MLLDSTVRCFVFRGEREEIPWLHEQRRTSLLCHARERRDETRRTEISIIFVMKNKRHCVERESCSTSEEPRCNRRFDAPLISERWRKDLDQKVLIDASGFPSSMFRGEREEMPWLHEQRRTSLLCHARERRDESEGDH